MHSASALIFYIYIYFRKIPGSSSELFRRKLHEWVFNVVRSLYLNYFCKVSVNDEYSDEFPVKGGVHYYVHYYSSSSPKDVNRVFSWVPARDYVCR